MLTNWDCACSHILYDANAKMFICHGVDSCNSTSQKSHQVPADCEEETNAKTAKTNETGIKDLQDRNKPILSSREFLTKILEY